MSCSTSFSSGKDIFGKLASFWFPTTRLEYSNRTKIPTIAKKGIFFPFFQKDVLVKKRKLTLTPDLAKNQIAQKYEVTLLNRNYK